MAWRRRGADSKELEALHPGVPSWIRSDVLAWAAVSSTSHTYSAYNTLDPDPEIMREYEVATRRPTSLVNLFMREGVEGIWAAMEEEEFMDFLDFLVYRVGVEDDDESLAFLERVLSDGGSEWRVGKRDGYAALEKRVPDGVAVSAAATIVSSGSAGDLLAEAWHAVFGRNPDTEEAYEKAIKAVEAAGAQVVSPSNKRATLGTMIRDMKAQGAWKLPLVSVEADAPVRMAEALWQGQESRHGGNGYRKPTPEEAEAALLLAVPLVQWFSSGVLARR